MKKPNFAAMNPAVAKAIEQMMVEQGEKFSLEKINLADLGRRTGISRAKLRRMKEHDFEDVQHALKGRKATTTLLSGYTGILDGLLKGGVVNSVVCLSKLRKSGFTGGKSIVKEHIANHQHLVPAPRHAVEPQGTVDAAILPIPEKHFRWTGASRGYRLMTEVSITLPASL